jgi:hypothetical protein
MFSKLSFYLTSLLREFALGRIHSFVPPQWGRLPLARLTGSRPNKGKTYRYSNAAFIIKNSVIESSEKQVLQNRYEKRAQKILKQKLL